MSRSGGFGIVAGGHGLPIVDFESDVLLASLQEPLLFLKQTLLVLQQFDFG